jgi:uncharacterized protein with ATP-grasp and redox domains
MRQALNTVRKVTKDAEVHRQVLDTLARMMPRMRLDQSPARLTQPVYEVVAEVTGEADPFRADKARTNREALALLPRLEALEEAASDGLKTGLHLAASGNMIDLGIGHEYDLEADVRRLVAQPFAVDATEQFRAELAPGRRLLYIGDNAGEIVFDRVLVEELLRREVEVTFAVKSAPIINDATMEDAEAAGLTEITRVIETGAGDVGVQWERCSDEFRAAYDAAEVILAKGQGNFETLDGQPGNKYFLLKAKCDCVAAALGVSYGDIALVHQPV